ncbi:hypothetical protein [Pedobacter foliorum]|uniref:hypothetical protein n=1 Tax=Pedobacter foliorum TaxID=2739058 RepID=UPI0015653E93|nr:hypothetical protein [Pedobacter foliorum]NRF37194.1 hypothetical protein [Pedobacter foliorum]
MAVVFGCSNANQRSKVGVLTLKPDVKEMIAFANMSHDEMIEYLSEGKGFVLDYSDVIYKQRVTELSLRDSNNSIEVIKTQWKDRDSLFHSIHYEVRPSKDIEALGENITSNGFVLVEHNSQAEREYWLYRKDRYSLSVYKFNSKTLPVSVELHKY